MKKLHKFTILSIILFLLVISFVSASTITRYVGEIAEVSGDEVKFVVTDRLGSKRIIISEEGETTAEYLSLPYGQTIINNGSKYGFTGKEKDVLSGMHYFGARYYDSDSGRFTGVDPVASNHAYSYVSNNPMNYVDPSGMNKSNTAIFLVDVYESVKYKALNSYEEFENMKEVLKKANELGIPVYNFRLNDASTAQELLDYYNEDNWVDINKPHASAFMDTNLHEQLSEKNINSIIVMGYHQIACVSATIKDGADLNYDIQTSFDVIQGWTEPYFREIIRDKNKIKDLDYRIENNQLTSIEKGTMKFEKIDGVYLRRYEHASKNNKLLEMYNRLNVNIVKNYKELSIFKQKE